MKKAVVLFMILVFALNTFAQDKPVVASEKNVLKVNTLALILTTGSVFYERKLSDLTSAQMGVGYFGYKIGDTKLNGLFLTPEVRFYVRKNAIDGFYMAPYLRYNRFKFESNSDSNSSEGTFTSFGGGADFGRQWIFQKGFVMDLFFGGHYTGANVELSSGSEPSDLTKISGFRMRVGFCIGFAF
jgi:hypothetical protein